MKLSPQQRANLRVCMSCEWIYLKEDSRNEEGEDCGCPKCNWPSYGARFVYGDKAYRYAITQKPWFDKKMADLACKLHSEINKANCKPKRVRAGKLELVLNGGRACY